MKKISNISVVVLVLLLVFVLLYEGFKRRSLSTQTPPQNITAADQSPRESTSKSSSDGTVEVTMTVKSQSENIFTYNFSTQVSGTQKTIYETTADSSTTYFFPDNAWSPDNKQFFIIKSTSGKLDYLVFKASGDPYAPDEQFLDINDYWSRTKYTSTISTITGWAGNDLLVVYTTNKDGSDGDHYWFVTSSRSFMHLSQ